MEDSQNLILFFNTLMDARKNVFKTHNLGTRSQKGSPTLV
jgi:hypothetical protein